MLNHVQPHFSTLSNEQIERLHDASLNVLEQTGVRVMHADALQLLRKAGCRIKGDDIVFIPAWLVEESIRSAPSRVAIYNREGESAMQLEGHNTYYGLGTDLPVTEDLYSGEHRRSVLQDIVNNAIIADACSEIDYIGSNALASDVAVEAAYLQSFLVQLQNSSKPIFFTAADEYDLALMIEMAELVAGGEENFRARPNIIHYAEPTSPLTHSGTALAKLLLCAKKGVPICYNPAALSGASGPITIAGLMVLANAETLSGIVLHQLAARGAPIISGFSAGALDMKTMVGPYASPEVKLANSAMAEIYHYYRIPMWSTSASDANTFDGQTVMEHAIAIYQTALDGANLVHNIGYMGQGMISNPASLVMCNEMIAFARRMLRGYQIDDNTIGLDTIHQVGHGGSYLGEQHTLDYMRSERWDPSTLNRVNLNTWADQGSKTYQEKLIERARTILETHQPKPMADDLDSQLQKIASRIG
jgi:trimethylamine---corrinoid protein Co-methyltransferase